MRRTAWASALALVCGCHEEKTGVVAGPPLRIEAPGEAGPPLAIAPAATTAAPVEPPKDEFCPVNATFLELAQTAADGKAVAAEVKHVACETRVLFVVDGRLETSGDATARAGEKASPWRVALGAGDALVTQGKGGYRVHRAAQAKGDAPPRAVLAILQPPNCEPNQFDALSRKLVDKKSRKDLVWAGGAMRARPYIEGPDAAVASVGWLEGTAPVAEHAHDTSWEVLCAATASGTMTLAGKSERLGPGTCVKVPPGAKHAWAPDPGSKLSAVQFYTPPGPEQRFHVLAGDARDAGK